MRKFFLFLSVVFFLAGTGFSQKKNVLFILVDDLKPLLGAYGDPYAVTPNIDRLAGRGFLFERAYTQQAVCAPSRASMLTGLRPDRTGVWDLKTQIRARHPQVVTLPQLFKEKGYQTYAIGKVFDPRSVDRGHDKRSWTIPYVAPFDLMTYTPKPKLGYYQAPDHVGQVRFYEAKAVAHGMKGGKVWTYVREHYKPSTERWTVPDEAYLDGALAEEAVRALGRFAKTDQPFMLMVGFKKPHLPFVAPEKYWTLYDAKKIPEARFQRHARASPELAYHNSPELRSYTDIPEAFDAEGTLNDEKQRELIHGYYACVSYVDAQIGKVLDKLKETGLEKNTIVVLWGDHGWHLGDHGLWTKHTNFEQATRLPLIVYDPGMKPGRTDVPVESVDIFPTVCELAGVTPPSPIQGESLTPLFRGDTLQQDFAMSQWPTRGGKGGMGYSLRTSRYRYTEWYRNYKSTLPRNDRMLVAVELYDYLTDPQETKNLARNRKYAGTVKELREMLHTFLEGQVVSGGAAALSPADGDITAGETPGKPRGIPLRQLAEKNLKPGTFYLGATIYHSDVGTPKAKLLAEQFMYTTPANAVKQSTVHPVPERWDWSRIEKIIRFAEKNDIVVRLHGPVSPQCSPWAKDDARTPEELMLMMTEYMTAECEHFRGRKTVKWMDVVNETVDKDGSWFGPKKGTDKWENPWLAIGLNDDGIPLYIEKAFEIATEKADPAIGLVYNQHLAMDPVVWDKVKETVLYLKKKGYRVDGIGWQAHLKEKENVGLDPKALDYLSDLIRWTHQHGMAFHITEFDYKMPEPWDARAAQQQAIVYANILKVVLRHRSEGLVTWNTWGIQDGHNRYTDGHRYMFDEQLRAKPAYYAVQRVLENPDDLTPVFTLPASSSEMPAASFNNGLLKNGDFEDDLEGWITWGPVSVTTAGDSRPGMAAVLGPASGIKQKVTVKAGSSYVLSGWLKSAPDDQVIVKVVVPYQEKPIIKKCTSVEYTPVNITFDTGKAKYVTVLIQKWTHADTKVRADDFSLREREK